MKSYCATSLKLSQLETLSPALCAYMEDDIAYTWCGLYTGLIVRGEYDGFIGWGHKKSGLKAKLCAQKAKAPFVLAEEGFIRSLAPPSIDKAPLSYVFDKTGIYYDSRTASDVEDFLQNGPELSDNERKRAKDAIAFIRKHKLSKYNHAPEKSLSALGIQDVGKKNILVIDQAYGDESVAGAQADESSFERMLLEACRENPDANILIKTHPAAKRGYLCDALERLDSVIKDRTKFYLIEENINSISLLEQIDRVYTVSSQMGLEALFCDKEVCCYGLPFYAGWGLTQGRFTGTIDSTRRTRTRDLESVFTALYIRASRYVNPYTMHVCSLEEFLDIMAFRKAMNDENQGKAACVHISRWKRRAFTTFISAVGYKPRYFSSEEKALAYVEAYDAKLYAWSSRMSDNLAKRAEEKNIELIRVEDGFIRSKGLGAALIPPQSLCFDDVGIYYDGTRPSKLERFIQNEEISETMAVRARQLINIIKAQKISKYNLTDSDKSVIDTIRSRAEGRPVRLVIGQAENDDSIAKNSSNIKDNLSLVNVVREEFSDGFIVYKPHPDVEKRMRSDGGDCKALKQAADMIVTSLGIEDILSVADSVHVNTSLAGFEALLRGKDVYCYGLPFYAGWGLTHDKIKCERRTRIVTLEHLVAFSLILYPRYIHPRSGALCRAEDVVRSFSGCGVSLDFYHFISVVYSCFVKVKNSCQI